MIKDPDARLDYVFDWEAWLDGDTITAATVTETAGVTASDPTFSANRVFVWLDGGTLGGVGTVTVRISTAQGRIDERTLRVKIAERSVTPGQAPRHVLNATPQWVEVSPGIWRS